MSLVHQALRKAEQEKLRRTGIVAAAPAPATVAVPVRPPTRPPPRPEPVAPPPSTTVALPRTPSHLLPVLLSCVAFVAIVAIVVIVVRSSSAPIVTPTPPTSTGFHSPAAVVEPRTAVATAHTPEPPRSGDSTQPTVAETERYQLSGIAQGPDGRPTAFINGQLRYEGQFIDGATVQKIERDRVTLLVDGQTVVKRLF